MSDQQVQSPEPEATTQCTICGNVPGPIPNCTTCHGNQSFVGPRAFTLTEERQRRSDDPERYTRTGNVGPAVVNLPGSFNPAQGS